MECSKFRRIKLKFLTVKLIERIINHRLRTIVELGNIDLVFRRGRSSMNLVHVVAIKFLQAHCVRRYRKSITYLRKISPHIFDMEHQSNDRDSSSML